MTSADLTQTLEALRVKRGYLLPHHGLMATAMPDVLETYDALYSLLAFEPRELTEFEHEFVWLAILAAKSEPLATHHVFRLVQAGGTAKDVDVATALAVLAAGSDRWSFAADTWRPHVAALNPAESYLAMFRQAANHVPLPLAHLGMLAALTCIGNWRVLSWQLEGAYADDVSEKSIAQALALCMFPGSVPHFARAASEWQKLILSREVEASEPFRAWADLSGQGGFDEASRMGTIEK